MYCYVYKHCRVQNAERSGMQLPRSKRTLARSRWGGGLLAFDQQFPSYLYLQASQAYAKLVQASA